MSSQIQWFTVRLGLFGLFEDRIPQAAHALREEFSNRPYLTYPMTTWNLERLTVELQDDVPAPHPEQASAFLIEELYESAHAVLDKVEGLHIEILDVRALTPVHTLTQIYSISELHPAVEIELTLGVRLNTEYLSVGSSGRRWFLEEQYDPLWSNGLWEGPHDAIQELEFPLASAGLEVKFLELTLSEPIGAFSQHELAELGRALRDITHKGVSHLLSLIIEQTALPPLSIDDAKKLLLVHGYRDLDDPRAETGFVGALMLHHIYFEKQTSFTLREENFREVMQALATLAPQLQAGPSLDRDVMDALWNLCLTAKEMVGPQEAWRKEGIMTEAQVTQLTAWVDAISYVVGKLLAGQPMNCGLVLATVLENN